VVATGGRWLVQQPPRAHKSNHKAATTSQLLARFAWLLDDLFLLNL